MTRPSDHIIRFYSTQPQNQPFLESKHRQKRPGPPWGAAAGRSGWHHPLHCHPLLQQGAPKIPACGAAICTAFAASPCHKLSGCVPDFRPSNEEAEGQVYCTAPQRPERRMRPEQPALHFPGLRPLRASAPRYIARCASRRNVTCAFNEIRAESGQPPAVTPPALDYILLRSTIRPEERASQADKANKVIRMVDKVIF
jgi:hypothetical protein